MASIIESAPGEWDGTQRSLHLAPMAGVSELPFRLLARECGADLTITEFTSSAALTRDVAKSWTRLENHPDERPFIPQIFGGDPEEMTLAASMLDEKADIIDLNFGCPAPKVTKICAGAALMGQPEDLISMSACIIEEVSAPVTAKMRMGTGRRDNNAVSISIGLEEVGVQRLCVHGRTLKQRYSGEADWTYIKDVVDSVDVPVIANGDVVDTESAALCLETTGAAGLMIGRGAIGRPGVFGEIKVGLGWMEESELPWVNDEWFELEDIARSFATRRWCWNRYLELARATTGLRPKWMKRHAVAFTKGLPGAKAARSSMHEVSNSEELGDAIMAMLSQ